jgi:hypothetical protein
MPGSPPGAMTRARGTPDQALISSLVVMLHLCLAGQPAQLERTALEAKLKRVARRWGQGDGGQTDDGQCPKGRTA